MFVPFIPIINAGNIGSVVTGLAVKAGASTQVLVHDTSKTSNLPGVDVVQIGSPLTGGIVVLVLLYTAIDEVTATCGAQTFVGKVAAGSTSPLDFATLDSLILTGNSAAAELTVRLPDIHVVRASNIAFAAILASGTIDVYPVTILATSDSAETKTGLRSSIETTRLTWTDAGKLKRAERMEAFGALNIVLGATEQVGWTSGLVIVSE